MSTTVVSVCALCGQVNTAAALYISRGLLPPKVCRTCHRAREARLQEISGRVDAACSRYAFILGDDGVRYYAPAAIFRAASLGPLVAGDRVAVLFDPQAKVEPAASRGHIDFDVLREGMVSFRPADGSRVGPPAAHEAILTAAAHFPAARRRFPRACRRRRRAP